MKIEFYKHSLNEEDIKNAAAVLRSIFLTTGSVTSEFEERFSQFTGVKYTVALNSCTAALHLSLLALGIKPGDEVITTPMTFIATATAILHAGAKPVFVDIERETGLIDPKLVESAVTSRTKAIVPIHLYGTMADMITLKEIADFYGLFIIEDSAHCIEGERDGVRPGHISDAACFSFYATKNLTCGEGGAIVTNNKELAKKVRTLRQHGLSKEAADRYYGTYQHWDMLELGWKYNLGDIYSALLIHQLERLPNQWLQRKRLYDLYRESFKDISDLNMPSRKGKSAYHLFTILVSPQIRNNILYNLGQKGIGVAVNYRSIHTLTWFSKKYGFSADAFPNAHNFGERTISLPFYPSLKMNELSYVVENTRELFKFL